jgi:hypothetical protein
MTVQAVTECQAKGISFEEAFRYQYVISKQELELPGFATTVVDGHVIQTGKDLNTCALTDKNGKVIGCFLGIAADHQGRVITGAPIAELNSNSPDFWTAFVIWLRHVAGRYAVVVTALGETRYYCDAVGMIGACHNPTNGRIGASVLLCLDRELRFNPLFIRAEIEAGKATDGLLMTEDEEVQRINPSFFVRLSDQSQERFWPLSELFEASEDHYIGIYEEMIGAERNIIKGLTEAYPTALAMSGGNDSRILLALAKEARANFKLLFTNVNNYSGRRDAHSAKLVSEAVGCEHAVFLRDKNRDGAHRRYQVEEYRLAAGTIGPCPPEVANGLINQVPNNMIVFRGHQTNHMRGQYLPNASKAKWMRVPWQIKKMGLLPRPIKDLSGATRFYPVFADIVAMQSENANLRRAEITFIETLISSALGKLFLGMTHNFFLSPFNSRKLIELSLSFDTGYRVDNMTTPDLIHLAEPAMSEVPYVWDLPADLSEPLDEDFLHQKMQDTEIRLKRLKALAKKDPRVP